MRAHLVAAVFVVAGAPVAEAELRHVTITPPAGWIEDHAAPDQGVLRMREMVGVQRAENQVWVPPDRHARLFVLEVVATLSESSRGAIASIERGTRRSMPEGTQLVLTEHELASQVLVRHDLDLDGQLLHVRRIYGVDRDGALYWAQAGCTGPAPAPLPCDAALATFALRIPNAAPLTGSANASDAYQAGYLLGQALVVVGGIVVVVLVLRRSRRRAREARRAPGGSA